MTNTIIKTVCFSVVTAFLASCGTTQSATDAQTGTINFKILGRGDWNIECKAMTNKGKELVLDETGRGPGNTGSIFSEDIVSASCTYAAGDAPVRIRMVDGGFTCPYGAYSDGVCDLEASANSTGRFDLKVN